jgi:hypothetical protein
MTITYCDSHIPSQEKDRSLHMDENNTDHKLFFEHHTYYPKHGLSDVELELSTTGFSIVAAVPDDGEVFSQGCEVVVDERKRASSIQGIDAS